MKILMVLTSHESPNDTATESGFWIDELAVPYYIFKDSGAEVIFASPLSESPSFDPVGDNENSQTSSTRRFKDDVDAQESLVNIRNLNDVTTDDFDAVFYLGTHGPLWNLSENSASISLIEASFAAGKPVAAVCHAQSVLRHVKKPDGNSLLQGKNVTGFSNTEEDAAGSAESGPFFLEDMLKENGGNYSKSADGQPCVVTDRLLITGQNPASSGLAAEALLERLRVLSLTHS